jgi:hypothetical protein
VDALGDASPAADGRLHRKKDGLTILMAAGAVAGIVALTAAIHLARLN